MEQLFKLIYEEILKDDTYITENDVSYQKASKMITDKENAIMNILEKTVSHSFAFKLLNEYQLAQNTMLYAYEYRDFLFYFSAGLTIGLTADKENLEKFKELALKMRNSL